MKNAPLAIQMLSDICRALAAQDRVYPLNDAIEVMDKLMALETKSNSEQPSFQTGFGTYTQLPSHPGSKTIRPNT